MSQAIFGAYGQSDVDTMHAMAARLRHRGAHEAHREIRPGLHLGSCAHRATPHDAGAPPLVFSGTINNRAELRQALGPEAGIESLTDERLLWLLYCARGADAFELIDGSFAIALFDAHDDALLLAADRWASQPLYFAARDGGFVFASEYRALLRDEGPAPQLDVDVAAYVLGCKYVPRRRTLLSQVQSVGPGELIRISDAGVRAERYKSLELAVDDARSEESHASELRDCILNSARRLTEGCDRVGVALSAGLDSTLTLGAVRTVAPSLPIYTYTASFSARDPDLALAAEVARYYGATHREIILSPKDFPQMLSDLIWRMEDPVGREEMVVYDAVAQRAAGETDLLLYGDLADLLFGGMPRHLLIKAASELPWARRFIAEFYDYTQSGAPPRSLAGKLLVNAYYRGRPARRPRAPFANDLLGKGLQLAAHEPLNSVLLASISEPSSAAALERLHTWAGLRMDSIFHARDVARCAFRIPGRHKVRGMRGKHILRVAAAGILPAAFVQRPKTLIRLSRDAELMRAVSALGDELLSPAAVRARGAFDPQEVAQLRRRVASARCSEPEFYYLWTLILLELWCRTYIDRRGARYEFTASMRTRTSVRRAVSTVSPARLQSGSHQ